MGRRTLDWYRSNILATDGKSERENTRVTSVKSATDRSTSLSVDRPKMIVLPLATLER